MSGRRAESPTTSASSAAAWPACSAAAVRRAPARPVHGAGGPDRGDHLRHRVPGPAGRAPAGGPARSGATPGPGTGARWSRTQPRASLCPHAGRGRSVPALDEAVALSRRQAACPTPARPDRNVQAVRPRSAP
ncbi:MAG: hypothetical protein MZU91_07720 [Desulfosudis oleivorans]|nr:hypothetical protein [Desulfosudis oleivorans]